ncbi:PPE domain-containing protein [Nocardia donostiensis]|uniref:PPE domain-containing protein n=1 Tax=Nocardia donostiensis TaxID=1538463 RepID=A0A1V2TA70_9NOCA|nr:PPE domain-containing protein [Nocardia donostiensis]ONM46348.1 hypothetical protein B0T46_23480 [Nocardia donostiensis]OQS18665.1 hypothetical protein B0T44_18370 [Nocardia donostiensis]
MALNVDLGELAAVAAQAADLARTTGAAMPRGWVLPAGADPISAAAVPKLNADAAALFNGVVGVLNKIQKTAHNIGAAAVDYAAADMQGAQHIGGSGGADVTNPVPQIEQLGLRRVPPALSTMTSTGGGDPLVYAQQLHTGPGPGPAMRFAESVRSFTSDTYTVAAADIDRASGVMQRWTPVGADAATELTTYRGWLDQLATALGKLADDADAYGNAFSTAKAKHPTPEEIIAARKELVRAMRSRDEIGTQAALAKFQEQNARSTETMTGYSAATENITNPSGAGGTNEGGSGDMNMLAQMLPTMMSAMGMAMNGLPLGQEIGDEAYDDYYDDYGYGDLGIPSVSSYGGTTSPGGVGIPSAGDMEAVTVGAMTTAATTATGITGGARAPVIEPLGGSSSGGATSGRGVGSPMMPYMPMGAGGAGAGAGGGGNGERNRIVAWHPDRLMYVDDTPHTEPVIGERPTIAPTVTSPTPAPTSQGSTRTGGTA